MIVVIIARVLSGRGKMFYDLCTWLGNKEQEELWQGKNFRGKYLELERVKVCIVGRTLAWTDDLCKWEIAI